MVFTDLLNSESIREYWEEIDYKPTPVEAAWLVYANNILSFEKKCDCWEEIIETMPDTQVQKRLLRSGYSSLHAFLRDYMALKRKFLEWFYNGEGCVYTVKGVDERYYSLPEGAFSSVDKALEYIKNESGPDCCELYEIGRLPVDPVAEVSQCCLLLNHNLEPVRESRWCSGDFWENCLTEEEQDILLAFEAMFFDFPVPFKKGDVLFDPYQRYNFYGDEVPALYVFLDNSIPEDRRQLYIDGECGDSTDMAFFGCTLLGDGSLFREVFGNIMDFEFYRGEFEGKNRVIKAASNYEKGLIDGYIFLRAYHQIIEQERAKTLVPPLYDDENLELAGINIDK